ncbi:2-oxo-4-hydroxy-4-carboxy-5-ureidoimidazoline decarboxylase [Paenibacillus sp. 1P07SE]|uniref:2-oxo-4-hydroxy-4-carboxy-5-ureidoimidazoline decarboxylase n=1 Tax=Paenibacillus sp. 1P07SE TaxID=3132209 RepID=UPI0039A674C0
MSQKEGYLNEINQMEQAAFVRAFGHLFEHSPWVAEQAWKLRPYDSLAHMLKRMECLVHQAETERQLDLLRAHPDLGARIRMTDASRREQQAAGLGALKREEAEQFLQMNKAYKQKFGFPFILAVRGREKGEILQAMRVRLSQSPEDERTKALQEVCLIAAYRLNDWVKDDCEEEDT